MMPSSVKFPAAVETGAEFFAFATSTMLAGRVKRSSLPSLQVRHGASAPGAACASAPGARELTGCPTRARRGRRRLSPAMVVAASWRSSPRALASRVTHAPMTMLMSSTGSSPAPPPAHPPLRFPPRSSPLCRSAVPRGGGPGPSVSSAGSIWPARSRNMPQVKASGLLPLARSHGQAMFQQCVSVCVCVCVTVCARVRV